MSTAPVSSGSVAQLCLGTGAVVAREVSRFARDARD
jgi:hypothetical protein